MVNDNRIPALSKPGKHQGGKMKFLVISLLSVSLLFATVYDGSTEDFGIEIGAPATDGGMSLDNPDNLGYAPLPEVLDVSTLADLNDPSSAYEYFSPVDRALSFEDEGSPARPFVDWSDDVEIYAGRVGEGQDYDIDEDTGDIYAIFDTDHATLDSLVCYRSQDGGATWSYFATCTNTDNEIYNPKIRVVKDASGDAWIVMMGIWQESGDDVLWTGRYTTAGTGLTFEQVATNVEFADMDGDVGSGAWAYVTYVPSGTTDVRLARNSLGGGGWVNDQPIRDNNQITPYPAVAAGAYGTVAVALLDERAVGTPQVRIRRSTDYGASFAGSAQVSNAGSPLADTDIAFSHGSTQTGWITVTYQFASGDTFGYYYSNDSGASWTYGTVFAGAGDDEYHGSIRARKATGALTVSYTAGPAGDVMFTWTTAADPQGFTTPAAINEFVCTGFWPSAAGWNGSGNSGILYTNWDNNYRLMWDWFGNTGIEGTSVGLSTIHNSPNPFNATTNISFSLAQSSPVSISVYNVAGQQVSTIADNQSFDAGTHSVEWNAQSFSPGVYFCRLNADGISQTHRMLLVK